MRNRTECEKKEPETVAYRSREELAKVAKELKDASPSEILRWGTEQFGSSLALACSFGYEDVALVHLLMDIRPETDIFYLDTDLLFPETYQTRDRLAEKYGISFIRVSPRYSIEEQANRWGEKLWERDPNTCCMLRKVEPLKRFLSGYSAWCTGIRREQSPTRVNTEVVEWDDNLKMVKLNPLAFWKESQVWDLIHAHGIPYNPMHDRMYPSIGCMPCTRKVMPGEDPRSGRWAGTAKTECGLHNRSSQGRKRSTVRHPGERKNSDQEGIQ
ncbi:phosphoadenylyl-sulfate reductase [Paludifilum halophilum]|uniref:Adenosine 5'-phosphosulfate reductase n=1 Tax=Paludifilum halophilum TaxID=1642702 RepID=A0A235BA60_9BACL|nr:phosphoadenylyl-sulfate reductase [Paludifilum halophilum]OYD09193.1 phosphoadenosine phosphosulfate reductase [Paludifilum halophilum]